MAEHYFSQDEFELVKAMHDERYVIEMDGLGAFGEKTGRIDSFDISDAQFDPQDIESLVDWEKLSNEDRDAIEEESYFSASEIEDYFGIDIVKEWNLDQGIIVFNREIGQSEQNFLEWERCVGDLHVDQDDYDEFMEEHEEFQTKEWHISQIKKYMNEHEISLEDLK